MATAGELPPLAEVAVDGLCSEVGGILYPSLVVRNRG